MQNFMLIKNIVDKYFHITTCQFVQGDTNQVSANQPFFYKLAMPLLLLTFHMFSIP